MTGQHIALVGFMASGKSTVGRALAEYLGFTFVDLDDYIESMTQRTISAIFTSEGETAFRLYEQAALRQVQEHSPQLVLSTGGGVVTVEDNCVELSSHWTCIYLRAMPATIQARVEQDGNTRPLLAGTDALSRIQTLLEQRSSLYERLAKLTIDVDSLSVSDIVGYIVDAL